LLSESWVKEFLSSIEFSIENVTGLEKSSAFMIDFPPKRNKNSTPCRLFTKQ